MKIAIATGGGDCPGLNAVIRAFVQTAIIEQQWQVWGVADALNGLLSEQAELIPLSLETVESILPQGGTILGTSNRSDPFRYAHYDAQGHLIYQDKSDLLLKRLSDFAIDALLIIGGDGSMRLAHALSELGVKVVGVPKTIDNDLLGTDITFGHDSACNIAMEALDRLRTTAYSHHRIMICEVMGRDAGWLAMQAGLSGAADIILIPELPYSLTAITDKLNANQQQGKKFSIIVIAEGAKVQGEQASTIGEGHAGPRFGGAAEQLAQSVSEKTTQEVRTVVLGHLQRGGSPTHFDRVLATRLGCHAVSMLRQQQFAHMAALRQQTMTSTPLVEVTQGIKRIDPAKEQLLAVAKGLNISLGI